MLAPVKLKTYYVFSSVYLPGISLKGINIYIFEQYVSNSQHQKSPHTHTHTHTQKKNQDKIYGKNNV